MLTTLLPLIKALHIIAVISWMAALLYLPRLFVYHASLSPDQIGISNQFKIMEYRLATFIMEPAMIVTWLMGIFMVVYYGLPGLFVEPWFLIKFIAVVAMTFFHQWLKARLSDFTNDKNEITERSFRIANEFPTVLMILIVIMVIVRPF